MTIYICAIAAMARNRVIGRDNKIPWHIPEEFRHFKRTTMGKPVIMGRRTWESLGRPLPGRTNIVVSHDPAAITGDVIALREIDTALAQARDIALRDGVDEVFVIGGAQIYAAAFPQIDRFYLTVIDRDYDGDAVLDLDFSGWRVVSTESFAGDPAYTTKILERP